MILDMNNPEHTIHFNRLQKGRGIKLISKYLPNLLVHKQVYSINTLEEWQQIKHRLPEIVTIRTDNLAGMPIPETGGITRNKENVEQYFEETRKKEQNPYFLCMEFEEGTNERVDTAGGFVIDANICGMVYIGHTGMCFDCRELTKGKAEHETWKIAWDEISCMTSKNHRRFHVQTISQEVYRATTIERMKFLIKEYPERKDEIIEKMPKKYQEVEPRIMDNLIEEVLIPLALRKQELLQDGLDKFDVELNILKNGRLVPMEICRPERFRVYKKDKESGKSNDSR